MIDPIHYGTDRAALWFSATAFVVSALSFVAAGTQTWLTYQHNRLSVMPKLDWRVTYVDAKGPRMDVVLVNAGLGPAKVSNIKINVGHVIMPLEDGRACDAISTLIGVDQTGHGADCFEIAAEDWVFVKPGEDLTLYTAGRQPGIDPYQVDGIDVSARYCSLYDQCEDL